MPEPLLYVQALGVSAVLSAVLVSAMLGLRRHADRTWLNSACVFGIGLGVAGGCCVLSLQPAWPPANALDRLLTIIIPAALIIELIAGTSRVPDRVAWILRISLTVTTPRILWHGSVYLTGGDSGWPVSHVTTAMILSGFLLALVWGMLVLLSRRSPGVSIPLSLSLTTLCAGLTVMMAGYIKGGALAFPLSATIIGAAIAVVLAGKKSGGQMALQAAAIPSIGIVSLFGLLFIGRFFGRLSTGGAVVLLLTPLLCWATEPPLLRNRRPWLGGALRLLLVSIPLAIVLALAKRTFDRDMGPLL